MQAGSEVIMQLKQAFAEADIDIAYNVTTLDFGVKGGVNLFDKAVQVRDVQYVANKNERPSEKGFMPIQTAFFNI